MKRILIVFTIFIFAASSSGTAYAWPWDKKEGAKTEPANQAKKEAVVIAAPKMPNIPKPMIPKVIFVNPDEERPQPSVDQRGVPKAANVPQPPPNVTFEMKSGELVSAEIVDNNTIVKIKTSGGEELVVYGEPNIVVTKSVKITELGRGEKVTLHYLADKDAKRNKLLFIMTGEMPPINVPMPQQETPQAQPQTQSEKP
jgi:hypothetical protein